MADSSYTLLIVDDSSANRAYLTHILEEDGYRIVQAKSGEECLELAETENPALILLDVVMGGIDGFETLRRLKANGIASRASVIMTINGAGFIALAAVSFGRWTPKGVSGASLLFGTAVAMGIYMVNIDSLRGLPPEFFSIMPYIITLVTLVIFSGKDYAPRADGIPYEKGAS